jgi:hypothetical protein
VIGSRSWKSVIPGLALVFSLGLLLRWPIAAIPLERDEGEYAYIAQRWLLGDVPYQASFDQKPPGVFAAYAVILRCLGNSPSTIHWGVQIYSLGTLALIFLLGRRLFSPLSGLLAALLAALLMTDPGMLGNAANTELFMLLPLAGAFRAALPAVERNSFGWALLTGALAAAALLFKQVAIFDALFFLLWLLFGSERGGGRLAGGMLLGGLAILASCSAYFRYAGADREFYDCVIGYNLKYATALPLRDYPASFAEKLPRLVATGWPVYLLAAIGLGGGLLRCLGRSDDPLGRSATLVAAWLLFAFLGVLPGGYFYPHYFLHLLPPLTLLGGWGSVLVFQRLPVKPRVKSGLACLTTAAAIAIGILSAPWYYLPSTPETKCRHLYADNPFPESMELGRFIAEHCRPEEPVFVFGSEPQIYFYAGRKSASRYIFVYPLVTAFSDTRSRQHSVMAELEHNRPALIIYVYAPPSFAMRPEIVVPSYLFRGVAELLAGSYEPIAAIPFADATPMPLLTGTELKNLPAQKPLLLTVWQRRRAGNEPR